MNAQQYTTIPGTEDANYWQLKSTNRADRSRVFVPRDAELHRSLLRKVEVSKEAQKQRRLRALLRG